MSTEAEDIYSRVTNQIIEAIEAGAPRYRMPWHITEADAFCPVNAASKRPYRGVNVLALWLAAQRRGYESGMWATYRQWQDFGAQVRKGEKSCLVVFWKTSRLETEGQEDADSEPSRRRVLIAKGYPVFNLAQVEGFTPQPVSTLSPRERIEHAEAFFSGLGASIEQGGIEASYDPERDIVRMPRFEAFRDPAGYYSTLGHELTHWTGAEWRLNRNLTTRFGSHAYAAEELIAELGAAFLCAGLRLSNEPRPAHAAYVASWLEVLRSDKRAIFTAASRAQQSVDWMHSRRAERMENAA